MMSVTGWGRQGCRISLEWGSLLGFLRARVERSAYLAHRTQHTLLLRRAQRLEHPDDVGMGLLVERIERALSGGCQLEKRLTAVVF